MLPPSLPILLFLCIRQSSIKEWYQPGLVKSMQSIPTERENSSFFTILCPGKEEERVTALSFLAIQRYNKNRPL
ncbi:hypothetical protein HMPREF0262_03386 [Clostridium sp. ATCC 29733]|nr:hypothetical protein HMPREF0262_03386 [Clostridium sp. ATCC 29733]